jgi:hypothetical protein
MILQYGRLSVEKQGEQPASRTAKELEQGIGEMELSPYKILLEIERITQ